MRLLHLCSNLYNHVFKMSKEKQKLNKSSSFFYPSRTERVKQSSRPLVFELPGVNDLVPVGPLESLDAVKVSEEIWAFCLEKFSVWVWQGADVCHLCQVTKDTAVNLQHNPQLSDQPYVF